MEKLNKNTSKPLSWHHTQDDQYLKLIKQRIESINLIWTSQFLDIIGADGNYFKDVKDIGCQAFQFYKEIKRRNFLIDYYGYELDQEYVDLGLKYFPELVDKVFVADFANINEIKVTDLSICSATLEHIEDWRPFLKKILGTTANTVLIRTFLDKQSALDMCRNPNSSVFYPIHQFSFSEFLSEIKESGFYPDVIRDCYTDSLPKLLEVYPKGIVRTQYVVVAKKLY
jgi:hypothetical protein